MKKIVKYSSIVILLIVLIIIIICFPQLYYFDNKLTYKNFNVYSDKPITPKIYLILDKVDILIKKSEIYDSTLQFKIFIRSDYSVHNALPWQFSNSAYAITRPIIRNIFISKGNLQSNVAYKISGGSRPLDEIIAHETVHVLIENKFKNDRAKFPEDWTKTGFLWKEEGYADYIARGSTLDINKVLSILQNKTDIKLSTYELEYFKYWFAVNYLFEKKKIKIKELMQSQISLDNILNDAMHEMNTHGTKSHPPK